MKFTIKFDQFFIGLNLIYFLITNIIQFQSIKNFFYLKFVFIFSRMIKFMNQEYFE